MKYYQVHFTCGSNYGKSDKYSCYVTAPSDAIARIWGVYAVVSNTSKFDPKELIEDSPYLLTNNGETTIFPIAAVVVTTKSIPEDAVIHHFKPSFWLQREMYYQGYSNAITHKCHTVVDSGCTSNNDTSKTISITRRKQC